MTFTENMIIYAESVRLPDTNAVFVNEYIFKNTGEKTCDLLFRSMSSQDSPPSPREQFLINNMMAETITALKTVCETMKSSLFDPAFQKS